MNSGYLMPFDAISKNVVKDIVTGISYLSGTGFFVYFPPFENEIFYITSRHCLISEHNGDFNNSLLISYASYNHMDYSVYGKVEFSNYIEISETKNELEDIIIFRVSNEISQLKKQILLNRSLKLFHIDNVDNILRLLSNSRNNGKVRIIGFPTKSETELTYTENYEIESLRLHPRGLNGWLKISSYGIYDIVDTNWEEETLGGFSGSPALAILSDGNAHNIMIIGVVIAGDNNKKIVSFVSINPVTQAIAQILCQEGYFVPIE